MKIRKCNQRNYRSGEKLLFMGSEYTLLVEFTEKRRSRISLQQDKMILEIPGMTKAEERADILENWYRKQARYILTQRVEGYATLMRVSYDTIRIKDQKTCWGSCSNKRNLNFNYRIIMAPEEVIDYIVVHELCHLRQMNHSPEFWREVANILPEYARRRKWLKENGSKLHI